MQNVEFLRQIEHAGRQVRPGLVLSVTPEAAAALIAAGDAKAWAPPPRYAPLPQAEAPAQPEPAAEPPAQED